MRRYIVTMLIMAFLIGSLFQAADLTGIRLMRMFGTIGIALFGVVGTLALTRWQSDTGRKAVESALKSLEPEYLITDWALRGDDRPDYLIVGPCGLVAVCLDDVSQSTGAKRAAVRVARSCERVQGSVRWLRDRLAAAESAQKGLPGRGGEISIGGVLVLVRRRVVAADLADGVTVVNADGLAESIRSLGTGSPLDEPARIALTRFFRQA